jgi:hypothetical protein
MIECFFFFLSSLHCSVRPSPRLLSNCNRRCDPTRPARWPKKRKARGKKRKPESKETATDTDITTTGSTPSPEKKRAVATQESENQKAGGKAEEKSTAATSSSSSSASSASASATAPSASASATAPSASASATAPSASASASAEQQKTSPPAKAAEIKWEADGKRGVGPRGPVLSRDAAIEAEVQHRLERLVRSYPHVLLDPKQTLPIKMSFFFPLQPAAPAWSPPTRMEIVAEIHKLCYPRPASWERHWSSLSK